MRKEIEEEVEEKSKYENDFAVKQGKVKMKKKLEGEENF